ncbi:MAG TPA: hypothetical protein DCM87_01570 [Planctomycetes bacterium]|nr:hypothetical protein [Planctomycetota bacterium]
MSTFRILSVSLVFLALVCLAPPTALGADVYVSAVCGSDITGNGTLQAPYASIETGLSKAFPGDTMRVLPSSVLAASCPPLSPYVLTTVDKNVQIIAEAGPGLTLCKGFVIADDKTVTIRGFTVANDEGNGITVGSATTGKVTIENCVISHCRDSGIYKNYGAAVAAPPVSLAITNCVIVGCGACGVTITVARPNLTNYIPAVTIDNSIIAVNTSYAIGFTAVLDRGGPVTIRYSQTCGNLGGATPQIQNATSTLIDIQNPLVCPLPGLLLTQFQDANLCDFRLQANGTLRETGNPACMYRNPDGSRNDPGAFGGPGCIGYYPFCGPVIECVEIEQTQVPTTIRVRIKVR